MRCEPRPGSILPTVQKESVKRNVLREAEYDSTQLIIFRLCIHYYNKTGVAKVVCNANFKEQSE